MRPFFDEYNNWVNGVSTSTAADMLPEGFSPRGKNTMLVNIGQNTAQVGARKGPQTGNVTPITGSPIMHGQYQLKRLDGTKIQLLVSDGGRLDKYNSDTTTSVINASAFTAGLHLPSFTTVSNMAIIANGADLKKTDGTTVWRVGMVRPAAPTATAAAGGAMAAGVWDVGLTYFNSTTGEESSLSDWTSVTLGGANFQINISWGAPSDAQVDYVRVYVRQQSVGANGYLAIAGLTPAPNVTWNGFALATLATVANISAVQYSAFKIVAPTTTVNDPPTSTWQYPVWHNQRLFLFDTGNAYYSNITNLTSHPESFDSVNNIQPVNPSDGDIVTGAVSFGERLFIFKKYSMWAIDGYDPSSWTLTKISDKYGCGSHRTIVIAGGALYWWSNTGLGPLALIQGSAQPLEIGKEFLSTTVAADTINTLALNLAVAEVDEANDVILFSVPLLGSNLRNNTIIPFNYRVKRFVSDAWNPMDVSSFAVVEDLTSTKNVYIGGYAGQVFKWWQTTNDAVPSSTTGSGTVTGAGSSTTLVDGVASFSTTGGKLIERYVYHIPVSGDVQRRRITANTSTILTVTPAWDQAPVVGDSYIVGGIDWQLDTPWGKSGAPFLKKRFEFLYVEASSAQDGVILKADIFTKDNLSRVVKTLTFSLSGSGDVYGSGVYGSSHYSQSAAFARRKAMAVTGKSYRIRLRQLQANKQVTVRRVAVQGNLLGSKT